MWELPDYLSIFLKIQMLRWWTILEYTCWTQAPQMFGFSNLVCLGFFNGTWNYWDYSLESEHSPTLLCPLPWMCKYTCNPIPKKLGNVQVYYWARLVEVNIHSLTKNKVAVKYMLLNVSFCFPKCITPLEANKIRLKLDDSSLFFLKKIFKIQLSLACSL